MRPCASGGGGAAGRVTVRVVNARKHRRESAPQEAGHPVAQAVAAAALVIREAAIALPAAAFGHPEGCRVAVLG
jgi:hypothetical protein